MKSTYGFVALFFSFLMGGWSGFCCDYTLLRCLMYRLVICSKIRKKGVCFYSSMAHVVFIQRYGT